MSIGQELLDVPFGDMVVQLASAIAEGQYKMDLVSCKIANLMGDKDKCEVEIPNFENGLEGTEKVSLLAAGFQPTFYQFTDTIIEVKISIKITKSTEANVSGKFGCSIASVSASYSSKYSYSAEGASLIRTKITPVPPNAFMQNLLNLKAQMMQKSYMKKFELAEKELEKEEEEEEEKKNEGDKEKEKAEGSGGKAKSESA